MFSFNKCVIPLAYYFLVDNNYFAKKNKYGSFIIISILKP